MWLVGVVSRRWVWLEGGIYGYGYNVSVWLVGGVIRRYIDILTIIINFSYSTCISSFFSISIPTLFIFKMFFRSCTVHVRKEFTFCYHCLFLKQCDHFCSVPFSISFCLLLEFKWYCLASVL